MKAITIIHKGEKRVKVEFPYNADIATKLKKIHGAMWSATQKAWHIPYTSDAILQLKSLFPNIEYPQNQTDTLLDITGSEPLISQQTTIDTNRETQLNGVSVTVYGRKIIIKLPKNKLDTQFILGLRFSKWDAKQFCWIIPNYPGNLEMIKDYFKDRILELVINEQFDTNIQPNIERKIDVNDLLVIKTNNGRLKLIYAYNVELTKTIKTFPYKRWDVKNKWWSIPYSEKFLNDIKVIANELNLRN